MGHVTDLRDDDVAPVRRHHVYRRDHVFVGVPRREVELVKEHVEHELSDHWAVTLHADGNVTLSYVARGNWPADAKKALEPVNLLYWFDRFLVADSKRALCPCGEDPGEQCHDLRSSASYAAEQYGVAVAADA